jgi:hypothetical protein
MWGVGISVKHPEAERLIEVGEIVLDAADSR